MLISLISQSTENINIIATEIFFYFLVDNGLQNNILKVYQNLLGATAWNNALKNTIVRLTLTVPIGIYTYMGR